MQLWRLVERSTQLGGRDKKTLCWDAGRSKNLHIHQVMILLLRLIIHEENTRPHINYLYLLLDVEESLKPHKLYVIVWCENVEISVVYIRLHIKNTNYWLRANEVNEAGLVHGVVGVISAQDAIQLISSVNKILAIDSYWKSVVRLVESKIV